MSSASGENIKIIGAVPLRLSGPDAHGHTYTTRQMVYITDRPGPFFLSRGACTDLGVISDRFPTIGEASKPPENASVTTSSYTPPGTQPSSLTADTVGPCGYLRHTAPPSPL